MNKENVNEYINREKELLYIEYKLIEQLSIIRNKKNISKRDICNRILPNKKRK